MFLSNLINKKPYIEKFKFSGMQNNPIRILHTKNIQIDCNIKKNIRINGQKCLINVIS